MPWAALVIVVMLAAAYANSFCGVFVLDDYFSITTNPTIRTLSWSALQPPGGSGLTVEARPILNFSFAVNYAISGTNPWSYHALNLLIHVLAALALFGLVRAILERVVFSPATEVAGVTALLWGLHPLQTESVTYVVQRTESLMGFFYLGALYCHMRGLAASARSTGWFVGAIVFSALGMGTKEVMVSAPVLALVVDRVLFAGSFATAWRERRWYYAGLFGTWLILFALEAGHLERGGTIGREAGIAWWQYAFCQARGILHYVRLAIWPSSLVFDYGSDFVTFGQIWFYGIVDLALIALTLIAIGRGSALGLIGAWFFFILAPTSSVVGGTRQMLAEHRMYLPLLSVVIVVVIALYRLLDRRWARAVSAVLAGLLLAATVRRNSDYASDLTLYADNFAKRPDNAHSTYNYGYALKEHGRTAEAIAQYRAAIRLKPDFAEAYDDLANVLGSLPGREAEALACFEALARLQPAVGEVRNNMGVLLARMPGREADAIREFETAIRLKPDYAEAHYNLAYLLSASPERAPEVLAHYEAALRLKPGYPDAHNSLGVFLARFPGRQADAIAQLEAALRSKPNYAEAHNNLGLVLVRQPGRMGDALEHFEAAIRLKPDFAAAHFNLGMTLRQMPGREADAAAHFAAALKISPSFEAARIQLKQLSR